MQYEPVLKYCYRRILLHHKGATIFSIFAAFFAVFFHKGLITRTFYVLGDPFVALHRFRRRAWGRIRPGSLPLWPPHISPAFPLLSMPQSGLGSPLTWGYLSLPSQWAEEINVLAPYLLAPVFTYLYIRAIGKSQLAGILAGLCFGYGGVFGRAVAHGLLPHARVWGARHLV